MARDYVENHLFSLKPSIFFEAECNRAETSFPEVRFRPGTMADLFDLAGEENGFGPADLKFCASRLQSGDCLFIGESASGATQFSAWLMHGQMDLDRNHFVPTGPFVAYSYKLFTAGPARGKRICGAYYDFLKPLLLEQGYTKVICRIAPANHASIRAHERSGFRPVGRLWKLVLGPRTFYFADEKLRQFLPSITPVDALHPVEFLFKACRNY